MSERTSIAIGLLLACTAALATAAEVVDWRDAARCVDRVCAVRGRVAAQEDVGGVIRLYFDPERRDVSVLLVRSLFRSWPSYAGREIVATGKVRRFRSEVEVVVQRPSDVTGEGDTAASPSPASTPTEPAAPRSTEAIPTEPAPTPEAAEVDRLRRQVEELEEKVRELESGDD